jgi:ribonuclease BN (tRNA processing enzyme)
VLDSLHPPLTEAFALRFDGGGKAVVFSGDTARNPALIAFAQGADLLVHEAMLRDGLPALMARISNGDDRLMRHWLRSHTFAHEAAEIATAAGVKALALHHLIPSDDPAYGPDTWARLMQGLFPGPLHIGVDGLVLPL